MYNNEKLSFADMATASSIAVFDFDLFFFRDNDVKNLVGHRQAIYTLSQITRDRVFITRVGVHRVPVQ